MPNRTVHGSCAMPHGCGWLWVALIFGACSPAGSFQCGALDEQMDRTALMQARAPRRADLPEDRDGSALLQGPPLKKFGGPRSEREGPLTKWPVPDGKANLSTWDLAELTISQLGFGPLALSMMTLPTRTVREFFAHLTPNASDRSSQAPVLLQTLAAGSGLPVWTALLFLSLIFALAIVTLGLLARAFTSHPNSLRQASGYPLTENESSRTTRGLTLDLAHALTAVSRDSEATINGALRQCSIGCGPMSPAIRSMQRLASELLRSASYTPDTKLYSRCSASGSDTAPSLCRDLIVPEGFECAVRLHCFPHAQSEFDVVGPSGEAVLRVLVDSAPSPSLHEPPSSWMVMERVALMDPELQQAYGFLELKLAGGSSTEVQACLSSTDRLQQFVVEASKGRGRSAMLVRRTVRGSPPTLVAQVLSGGGAGAELEALVTFSVHERFLAARAEQRQDCRYTELTVGPGMDVALAILVLLVIKRTQSLAERVSPNVVQLPSTQPEIPKM